LFLQRNNSLRSFQALLRQPPWQLIVVVAVAQVVRVVVAFVPVVVSVVQPVVRASVAVHQTANSLTKFVKSV
jgi:hypothetical protein